MTKTVWETESIRLTLLGGIEPAMTFSWSSLTGQQPDSVTNRPGQGVKTEEGQWGGGHLVISCQPGRFEVILNAIPLDPSTIPTLGDFIVVLEKFELLFAKVTFPKALRIAVGAKFNKFFGSEKEAVSFVGQLVPDFKPSADYCDLMIQYNNPKKFPRIGGLVINRIVKCSQLALHTVQFASHQQIDSQVLPVVQVEVDFNTSPASALPHPENYGQVLKAIFNELRSHVGGES
ncbi:hypothetical protein Q8X48_25005 [Pseudomonas sp. QLc11A]|uniref:Uncharacterized protein n=1 Tax=Pseudomonas azerbaijanorientalis TaxID=2842350 RepID=A0ABW8W6K1_9PSED